MTFNSRMADTVRLFLVDGKAPAIPAGGELLWTWFCDLNSGRTFHAHGPNPIGWGELQAYAALTRWPIARRHIVVLQAMDRAYLEFDRAERMPGAQGKVAARSGRPMSPALFDTIFG
jgi:hypothetical protein